MNQFPIFINWKIFLSIRYDDGKDFFHTTNLLFLPRALLCYVCKYESRTWQNIVINQNENKMI